MIEVEGLVKTYGKHGQEVTAVQGIDMHVEPGEIVAFLGPNGAGKTTTLEILEGFQSPTAGTVKVMGQDPQRPNPQWREQLGIVLQDSTPIPNLTALETVKMQASYYKTSRNPTEVLELVGLADAAKQRASKLSGGQKRRLDLASALIGDPELIFLDEPTTGFDPTARRESWRMIEALQDLNKTVLLTTHYMDEADVLSDRIVIINHGVIIARGSAAELAASVGAQTRISWTVAPIVDNESLLDELPVSITNAITTDNDHDTDHAHCHIETKKVTYIMNEICSRAVERDIDLQDLQVVKPTLEDVYLTLIQNTDD